MNDAEQLVDSLLGDNDPKEEVARISSENPEFGAPDIDNLDTFTRAYIEAIYFTDEERLKEEAGTDELQIHPRELWKVIEDCEKFQKDNAADLEGLDLGELEHAGHDFWYTRNGHGVGFWDGDWVDDVGDRLTKSAQSFGHVDTYAGDDGFVYFM